MKSHWKSVVAVFAIATPVVFAATPAFAGVEYPEGGEWRWGNNLGWNYSDYIVGSDHSSTVICGTDQNRAVAGPNAWSNAGMWRTNGCSFYWNVL